VGIDLLDRLARVLGIEASQLLKRPPAQSGEPVAASDE
jgi:hypothetical protein